MSLVHTDPLSTTAQLVLTANSKRIAYTIKNNDASINIFRGFDPNVTSTGHRQGLRINAGQSAEDEHHNGEVWLIAASGTPSATVEEVT